MKKYIYLLALSIFVFSSSSAQDWYEQMFSQEDVHTVRENFDRYIRENNINRTIKPFERWYHRMKENGGLSGQMGDIPNYYTLYKSISKQSQRAKVNAYPQWTSLGPDVVPFGGGNGRLNFIKFHPDSTNIVFVGAPAGGLWRSVDGGVNFTLINDTLPVLGCSDLAIDPVNPNNMYLATGDRDAADTYSIGVLKSIDGGLTWDTTGMQWPVNFRRRIGRLDINPMNPNMIVAATSNGFYKSVDGGLTWPDSLRFGGSYQDVHFKPGDSSTIYLSGNAVFVSNDAGESFSAAGISDFFSRVEIAVTEDDPNFIYALGCNGSGGLQSIWRSNNSGQSWTMRYSASTGRNLLTWDAAGNGGGGQGWYDLAIAVSPVDKNHVVVGGINVWESFDGANDFGIRAISHWSGTGATYIHADQHDLLFKPGTTDLYAANDGGIFYTSDNGTTWTDLTSTLQITQSYRLGISQNTSGFLQAGNQDNGTILRDAVGSYAQVNGGDGMETIIDHSTDAIRYAAIQNGVISRSVNGSAYTTILANGVNGVNQTGGWETPYVMDPYQSNVMFVGLNGIWQTTNVNATNPSQINWVKVNDGSYPGQGKTEQLEIAPWNLDMLAATKGMTPYISSDGGDTWTNIKNNLPNLQNATITDFVFSPFFNSGTFTAYVTVSGFAGGNKIFRTTDAGQSWQNISNGIPNIPAHCIAIDPTSFNDEEIYVGTDIGVFYKNSSMNKFELYSNGLPNVWVQEMEIQVADGEIYACTYGRGLWKVPLYSTVVGLQDEQLSENSNVQLSVYPNPFNNNLEIAYDLKEDSQVSIELVDLQGKSIYLIEESAMAGQNSLLINQSLAELKPGMYILKFRAGSEEITQKIIKN